MNATLSGNTIFVTFDYDPGLVERVKAVIRLHGGSRAWDPVARCWNAPSAAALALVEEFPDLQGNPEFWQLVKHQHGQQEAKKASLPSLDLNAPLPDGRTLYEFQKTGVGFLLEHPFCILGDDMGLGKTVQSVVAATAYERGRGVRTVVLAPASVLWNWKEEAEAAGLNAIVHSWAKVPEQPPSYPYLLIADEAHYAQTLKAQRTQRFLALAEKAEAVWILTGTPMFNGQPRNLFTLLKAIKHPLGRLKSAYEKHFCDGQMRQIRVRGESRWVWDNTGASHTDELRAALAPYIIRRMKSDCLDLPPKTRVRRVVDPLPASLKVYNAKRRECMDEFKARVAAGEVEAWVDEEGGEHAMGEAFAKLNALRQAASMAKVGTVMDMGDEIMEAGQNVVVFSAYRESAYELAEEWGVAAFTGEVPKAHREEMIRGFQAATSGQRKGMPFVATFGAGGIGVTLTAACHVILMDRPMTPTLADQAEDRCNRIGQHWPVTAYWVQMFDVDKITDDMLEEKRKVIDAVLEGQDGKAHHARISRVELLRRMAKQ